MTGTAGHDHDGLSPGLGAAALLLGSVRTLITVRPVCKLAAIREPSGRTDDNIVIPGSVTNPAGSPGQHYA
jgi:hypothetical protein